MSIGRLVPVKGFDVLIRAIGIIKKICPEITGVIVGGLSGNEYERLCRLVSELGISDSVLFINSVCYEKLPLLYNAADIFVLSSVPIYNPHYEEENLPMTLIEASACGLPVIGSRCGGIPEIIADNETGILFESGNFKSLSQAIMTILRDSTLSSKFGTNGRKRTTELFNISKISNKMIELVECLSPK
jgi:glycosyltransferase involved in cell wall biosynthesis